MLSFSAPWVFGDKNTFALKFIGSDLLSLVGVVMSITLASATNINFELNKLQIKGVGDSFTRTRGAIRNSAIALIVSWLIALGVVVVKPLVGGGDTATSLVNGLGLLVVVFDALMLVDLTRTALEIVQPPAA